MKATIAIDGACRRNGQPTCVSSSGGIILYEDCVPRTFSMSETHSTNQRGELLALYCALKIIAEEQLDATIVTDSEYLFNAITKGWICTWAANHWVKADGEVIKNKDLWEMVYNVYEPIATDVVMMHIKGHVLTLGAVTAENLLKQDPTCVALYETLKQRHGKVINDKPDKIKDVQALSLKNNGFALDDKLLERLICLNMIADIVATKAVNEADYLFQRGQ